jgi:hypothetical protein
MERQNSVDGQKLILLINDHSERIRKQTGVCATTICCHCGLDVASSHIPFAFHGARPRRFLVQVGSYVCKVAALLARWRCPHCHRTFTDYPAFACPHKAYTLPQIIERAAKYACIAETTYRKGVCSENLPVFYAQASGVKSALQHPTDEIPSLSTMAHTSLFRWVTTLGGNAPRPSEQLPAVFVPAPRKYTSDLRRSILIACRAMCLTLLSGLTLAAPHR